MSTAVGYRVLARTYRPTTFRDMIGQEVMVQTLANAIALNRLPHAIMMTGVRGVGKTTTARLIAKALNCVGADGAGEPTIDPCGVCPHCVEIAQDRHLDVQEIDAASHTKVEEIRKIFDGVAYKPVSARYRIYIVDEVHMLSGHSFNALLKTLEEPPPHVKFLFATTEIRKVPITILSRCMRFSLRRVEVPVLAAHLLHIATKEQVGLEPNAATLLAKAAEGSVRDSLSLLDQAIALASGEAGVGTITDDTVRQMLGMASGDGLQQLLLAILAAKPSDALSQFAALYATGTEPQQLLQDLLQLVHQLTRQRLTAPTDDAPPLLPNLMELASMPLLTRAWQMLIKGIEEVQQAPNAFEAAEMILVRLAYASTLPTPYEMLRGEMLRQPALGHTPDNPQDLEPTPSFKNISVEPSFKTVAAPSPHPSAETSPPPQHLPSYAELVEALAAVNPLLAAQLRRDASLVAYEPPLLTLHMPNSPPPSWWRALEGALRQISPVEWKVQSADTAGEESLLDQERAHLAALKAEIADHPSLKKLQTAFPDLQVVQITSG
jgi:DNA polymerase-3 subunit gamma/tau